MATSSKTYKVKVDEFEFSFTREQIEAVDLAKISTDEFNLITNHRSVNVKVIWSDITGKKVKIEADGETFDIEIKDELEQMLDQMGYQSGTGRRVKEIKAPMPGLVRDIAVTNGQEVNTGDKILILEAMKMENSITVNVSARIKNIAVSTGQAVEKGQLLVELE